MTFNGATCRMSGERPLASRTMKKNQPPTGNCGCSLTKARFSTNEEIMTALKNTPAGRQVPDQLENLSKAGTRLNEAVNMLIERLQHVLRVEPAERDDPPQPAPKLVPLADRLRMECGAVVYAAGRIEDLLARLEV